MSASIATLPRSGGNGAALVVIVADLLMGLYSSLTKKVASQGMVQVQAKVAPVAITGKPANELSLWQLYRLTVGYDSISPKVAAKLRKELVG